MRNAYLADCDSVVIALSVFMLLLLLLTGYYYARWLSENKKKNESENGNGLKEGVQMANAQGYKSVMEDTRKRLTERSTDFEKMIKEFELDATSKLDIRAIKQQEKHDADEK